LGATQRINTGGLVTNHEGAFAVSITGVQPETELNLNIIGSMSKPGATSSAAIWTTS